MVVKSVVLVTVLLEFPGLRRRVQANGFILLECLLVLVVVAVLSLLGIHYYRDFEHKLQLITIRNDVAIIRQALNRYYHQQGCYQNGVFAGNLVPSLFHLGLDLPEKYQAAIVSDHQFTRDHKPIYLLQVTMRVELHHSSTVLEALQKALVADEVSGQRLIWINLPGSTTVAPGGLWELKGSSEQFRQQENTARQHIFKETNISSAYCAH